MVRALALLLAVTVLAGCSTVSRLNPFDKKDDTPAELAGEGQRISIIAADQVLEPAEALKGARIFVSRASFPQADEDEYYWVDLIGLQVVNREGQSLGTVADLIDTGPHTVLRIVDPTAEGGERLVPFVDAYVDDVNIAERRITVDWGLDF